jgi:hypothetical protein
MKIHKYLTLKKLAMCKVGSRTALYVAGILPAIRGRDALNTKFANRPYFSL